MAEISAAVVKALREKTQLPMMKCKEALAKAGGDEQKAMDLLRKEGEKFIESKGDRTTDEGRIAICASIDPPHGSMIELQCESAPVAGNEEFVQLANDLAKQLATGPGATSPEELWKQASPSKSGMTLAEQRDELANKIREVFRVPRIVRVDGAAGGYVHHDGKSAALLEVEGGTPELAKDIAMHITAMRPSAVSIDDLDPAEVEKERDLLTEAARKEGKPENILQKMVEGRMNKEYFAVHVLNEQPFVKEDKKKVSQIAKEGGMNVVKFIRWQLGGTE